MSQKFFRPSSFKTGVIAAAVAVGCLGIFAITQRHVEGQAASASATSSGSTSASPGSAMNVTIVTKPSKSIPLSFMKQGVISERLVNDGDLVKKGQVLLRQDSEIDQQEMLRLKVEAESDSRIDAAKADEKVKKLEYDRESKAPDGYAASEIEEAQAKLIEATKSVKVAEEDKEEAKYKYGGATAEVSKMEMKSPFDGIVQEMRVDIGQMSDPQNKEGAVMLVVNDPLWIEVRGLTTLQVSTLKVGEKLQVRYKNDASSAWQDATISYITPVADAGADRQLVRLELPNPQNIAAGMNMELNWPKKLLDTAPKDEQILSFK